MNTIPEAINKWSYMVDMIEGLIAKSEPDSDMLCIMISRKNQLIECIGDLKDYCDELSTALQIIKNKESQINGMRKDTDLWVQRELGLEELVYRAFLLSVCDLPEEEQLKHWDEFKKENNFKPLYK